MPEQALAYVRVSTKEQVENLSLETQRKACEAYCGSHGWHLDKVFVAEGESAKTTDRPEFLKMLEYCRRNRSRIRHLVVYSFDRFARNAYDHLAVEATLGQYGIDLHCVTQPIDRSPWGNFLKLLYAGLPQLDNELRADRTRAGMQEAARRGHWVWVAPLGFLNSGRDRDGPSLVHDDHSGLLIQRGFRDVAGGRYSAAEVLRRLTRDGLRSARGKRLGLQRFTALLRNPVYAGWLVSPTWGFRSRGDWEALVSQPLFDSAQAVLDGRRPTVVPHVRNHPDFPLRRFVICDCCGKPLTGGWSTGRGKRYAYYRCYSKGCRRVNVRKETLERHFAERLELLQPNPGNLPLFRAVVHDVWSRREADENAAALRRKAELRNLETQRSRLVDQLVSESQEGSDVVVSALRKRIEQVEEAIRAAQFEPPSGDLREIHLEDAIAFAEMILRDPPQFWTALPVNGKQRFQQIVFPEGIRFGGDAIRTAATSPVFRYLERLNVNKEGLASPTGFEPVLPP